MKECLDILPKLSALMNEPFLLTGFHIGFKRKGPQDMKYALCKGRLAVQIRTGLLLKIFSLQIRHNNYLQKMIFKRDSIKRDVHESQASLHRLGLVILII